MTTKQSLQLNFRITDDIRQCFDEIEETTGQKDYIVARSLFRALAVHWAKHKRISLPFEIADPTPVADAPPAGKTKVSRHG